jgi:hypothetical protein
VRPFARLKNDGNARVRYNARPKALPPLMRGARRRCVLLVTLTNDQSIGRIMRSTIAASRACVRRGSWSRSMQPAGSAGMRGIMNDIDAHRTVDAAIICPTVDFDPYT